MHQQLAQIAIAALGNAPEPLLVARRILPWHQSQPGRKLSPGFELIGLPDGGHKSRSRDHADAGDRCQSAAGFIVFVPVFQFFLQVQNLLFNGSKLSDQKAKRFTRRGWKSVTIIVI